MSANQWGGVMRGDESLRRQPVVLPLPRLGARHHRLRAHHPHPPGPRRRAHPLLGDVQAGRRGAQQQPLRHDARQLRVHAARIALDLPSPELADMDSPTTRSRATWTSHGCARPSPSTAPSTSRWYDHGHQQLRRRPAGLARPTCARSPRSAGSSTRRSTSTPAASPRTPTSSSSASPATPTRPSARSCARCATWRRAAR